MSERPPEVLVVLPTYSEIDNVESLVELILELHPSFQLLIVDDGSPDGTGALADRLASSDSRISVLHRPSRMGLGTAYLEGFRWGLARGYGKIVHMDADHSHDPRFLEAVVRGLDDSDLSIGSRFCPSASGHRRKWHRNLVSHLARIYIQWITGLPYRDTMGGFKGYRARFLEALDLDRIASMGYVCNLELVYLAHIMGFQVREVPIAFCDRRAGRSKLNLRVALEFALMVPRIRLFIRSHGFEGRS